MVVAQFHRLRRIGCLCALL